MDTEITCKKWQGLTYAGAARIPDPGSQHLVMYMGCWAERRWAHAQNDIIQYARILDKGSCIQHHNMILSFT